VILKSACNFVAYYEATMSTWTATVFKFTPAFTLLNACPYIMYMKSNLTKT